MKTYNTLEIKVYKQDKNGACVIWFNGAICNFFRSMVLLACAWLCAGQGSAIVPELY